MPLLSVSEIEKFVPALEGKPGLIRFLRHCLNIDDVSDLYDQICGNRGAAFATAFLKEENIRCRITGGENLERLPDGPFITISNHPYGALDGLMLIDLIGRHREGFKVMVNQFLTVIEALTPSLISVNPVTGDRGPGVTAANIHGVKEVLQTLREGRPVGFFPSGAVSDLHLRDLSISDREWQMDIVRIIKKARVPVVPVRFFDRNSDFYYLLGLLSWKIRILRLPTEVMNKKGQCPRIGIGPIISPEEQDAFSDMSRFRDFLRASVYGQKF
jgi:putative hemolysin